MLLFRAQKVDSLFFSGTPARVYSQQKMRQWREHKGRGGDGSKMRGSKFRDSIINRKEGSQLNRTCKASIQPSNL